MSTTLTFATASPSQPWPKSENGQVIEFPFSHEPTFAKQAADGRFVDVPALAVLPDGATLRNLREGAHLSVRHLAQALQTAEQILQRVEEGRGGLSDETLDHPAGLSAALRLYGAIAVSLRGR